jgi:hypothetical protein
MREHELVDISENLSLDAVNDGYDLVSQRGGCGYESDHTWLRRYGESVHVWPYFPSLGEVADAYRDHKREAAHV